MILKSYTIAPIRKERLSSSKKQGHRPAEINMRKIEGYQTEPKAMEKSTVAGSSESTAWTC